MKKKIQEKFFEYERADYTDSQREKYWEAVNILRNLTDEGVSRTGILSEIEDDL